VGLDPAAASAPRRVTGDAAEHGGRRLGEGERRYARMPGERPVVLTEHDGQHGFGGGRRRLVDDGGHLVDGTGERRRVHHDDGVDRFARQHGVERGPIVIRGGPEREIDGPPDVDVCGQVGTQPITRGRRQFRNP
jgi:hypothetical protein